MECQSTKQTRTHSSRSPLYTVNRETDTEYITGGFTLNNKSTAHITLGTSTVARHWYIVHCAVNRPPQREDRRHTRDGVPMVMKPLRKEVT